LLDEMEAEGLAPNRLTFNSAIDVCAKAAGGGAPADACLEQGLILLSTMENRALTPNVVTFVSLIDLCSRCALADDWARHFEDPALPLEQVRCSIITAWLDDSRSIYGPCAICNDRCPADLEAICISPDHQDPAKP
jgi:hypothetical protein